MTTPPNDAGPSSPAQPAPAAPASGLWPGAPTAAQGIHRQSFGKSYRGFPPMPAPGIGAPPAGLGGKNGMSGIGKASGAAQHGMEFPHGGQRPLRDVPADADPAGRAGAARSTADPQASQNWQAQHDRQDPQNPHAQRDASGNTAFADLFGAAAPPGMPGDPGADEAATDAAPPARLRRLKLALAACGAAVTVGLGAAIALLLTEGSPPLRLSANPSAYQSPHQAANHPANQSATAASTPLRQDSSGDSSIAAGAAGGGAACPVLGGPDGCPAMVAIPAGTYRIGAQRGDPDAQDEELGGVARPIAAFDLSADEITAGQWQRCVEDGACPQPSQAAASPALPVTGISWDAANGYAAWLSKKTGESYRLPTEAEWEYAARAGAATVFPWGDQLGQRHAHCGQCGTLGDFPGLAPVGSYPAQRGLYDMVGNAYEWVADCWTANHGQPLPPANAACRDKVQKGGAYDTLEADVRPVARTRGDRTVGDPRVGFRIARDVHPADVHPSDVHSSDVHSSLSTARQP